MEIMKIVKDIDRISMSEDKNFSGRLTDKNEYIDTYELFSKDELKEFSFNKSIDIWKARYPA